MTTAPYSKRALYWAFLLLSALCLLVVLVVVVFRIAGWKQRVVANRLRDAGWLVTYDYELAADDTPLPQAQPPEPKWLVALVGVDAIHTVVGVTVGADVPGDRGFALLSELPRLRILRLPVDLHTDERLSHVGKVRDIEELDLGCSSASDRGLMFVRSLPKLHTLDLQETEVTDEGLKSLKGLPLRDLCLRNTAITDNGLKHLEVLRQLESLDLYNCDVTDNGLKHLAALSRLKSLNLAGCYVTADGVAHLKGLTHLEELNLQGASIDDEGLQSFLELKSLRVINLEDTDVTEEGAKRLQAALPNHPQVLLLSRLYTSEGFIPPGPKAKGVF